MSNSPTGWAAFRLLRQSPAPLPLRRHGNRVHGRYSKAHIEEMRELRWCVKIIRGRLRQSGRPACTEAFTAGPDQTRVRLGSL